MRGSTRLDCGHSQVDPTTASVGAREEAFPVPHRRGDQVRHGGSGPDPRETPPRGLRTRDIYIPDLHIDSIKVKTRDFR